MQITSLMPALLLLLGAARPTRAAPVPRTQDLVFAHAEPEELDDGPTAAEAASRDDENDAALAERKQARAAQDEEEQEKLPRRSLLEPAAAPASQPRNRITYYTPDARDVAEAAARRARMQETAQRALSGTVEAAEVVNAERESSPRGRASSIL